MDKIQNLKDSKFKQQNLPAWRPAPSSLSTMITFLVFSVVYLAVGLFIYMQSEKVKEFSIQY